MHKHPTHPSIHTDSKAHIQRLMCHAQFGGEIFKFQVAKAGFYSDKLSLIFLPLTLSIVSSRLDRFHRGDVLITTATGVMTEEEGDKWGLVPTHAYAVLEIREYKVSCMGSKFYTCSVLHMKKNT